MEYQHIIETWFLKYSDDIYNFLVYYTGNKDVEDIVQEVFVKALKNYPSYNNKSSPKTWLISIARNLSIDYQRRNALLKWFPLDKIINHPSFDQSPDTKIELQADIEYLYENIRKLKRSYQDVLILRGIKGLTTEETAEILDWSQNKVNLTLHRAIKALKKMIKEG